MQHLEVFHQMNCCTIEKIKIFHGVRRSILMTANRRTLLRMQRKATMNAFSIAIWHAFKSNTRKTNMRLIMENSSVISDKKLIR